jgi:hypothetical protein
MEKNRSQAAFSSGEPGVEKLPITIKAEGDA